MATIVTNLTCELTGAVQVKVLQGNLFSADNAGNTINVFVTNHGEPAALGGTISANVIRGDGTTVAVSGAIDGNRAYIILPQACYAVPGVIQIIIKNTESSTVTTIAAVVANVYESTTDTVVDPGTIIPSVASLVQAIEDAVAEIPAGYNACFAPAYSTSSTYALGQYVTYSGYLYRCTTAITSSESWTAAHWTQVALANDVSSLKSAISHDEAMAAKHENDHFPSGTNLFNPNTVNARTNVDSDGNLIPSTSDTFTSALIPVGDGTSVITSYKQSNGTVIAVPDPTYAFYDENGGFVSKVVVTSEDEDKDVSIPNTAAFFRVVVPSRYAGAEDRICTTYGETVLFAEYTDFLADRYLDSTLTNQHMAAQAKAVGDKMDAIYKEVLVVGKNKLNPSVQMKKTIDDTTGVISDTTSNYAISGRIDVSGKSNAVISYINSSNVQSVLGTAVRAYYYEEDESYISYDYGAHTIPQNAAYCIIRFNATYSSAVARCMFEFGSEMTDFELYSAHTVIEGYIGELMKLEPLGEVLIDSINTGSVQIKLIGDSITHGVGGTGFDEDGAQIYSGHGHTFNVNTDGYCWANLLKSRIETQFPSVTVKNYGTRGVSVHDFIVWEMLPSLIEADDDIVIMMIGTNDRTESEYTAENAKTKFTSYLQQAVDYIVGQGKTLIMLTPIPSTPAADAEANVKFGAATVYSVNRSVAYAKNVTIYDLYSVFADYCIENGGYELYYDDTLHPNDKGYAVMYILICKLLGIPIQVDFTIPS